MKLKDETVRPVGLHPRLVEALWGDVDTIVSTSLGYESVVTSLNDGHADRPDSLHHEGKAADIRTWTGVSSGIQIGPARRAGLVQALQTVLGDEFDVVGEPHHIHIEYDDRR